MVLFNIPIWMQAGHQKPMRTTFFLGAAAQV